MNTTNSHIPQIVYSNSSVAKGYALARPRYPPRLFSFLSSLTPAHDLVWDAGTGNGQAATQISEYYKKVIATDISENQLRHAERRPNVTYAVTPPLMTDADLEAIVGPENSVDLVTVATAVHYFDLGEFYRQVKRVLKKPGGVIAVWVYISPVVNPAVDAVLKRFFIKVAPFFNPSAQLAFDRYRTLPFPFEGVEDTEMEITETRTLEEYLALLKTWSPLVVKEDLLDGGFIKDFEAAWGATHEPRTVKFPLFVKVGRV